MADMGSKPTIRGNKIATLLCSCVSLLLLAVSYPVMATEPITVSDASLSAAFYSDSSCLLTIDASAQAGKTVIDADVDNDGSRMLIHCDTDDGRRLTLLARGDSLNVSQLVPLLTRAEIEEGELGMIAWLTRSGVHYADDSVPRRYVIAGSVLLRKSPPLQVAGSALHSQRHAFGRVIGVLEPLLNSRGESIPEAVPNTPSETDPSSDAPEYTTDEGAAPQTLTDTDSTDRMQLSDETSSPVLDTQDTRQDTEQVLTPERDQSLED